MESCLYEGWVRHQRNVPTTHRFQQRLCLTYLDLDELDEVFRGRWLWSTRRPALARFRREDHLGHPDQSLAEAVRDLVEARIGTRPTGPIRLLTHLRFAGYVMNPVSFYYCYDAPGTTLMSVVAEVNNTPWGERHCYVVPREQFDAARDRDTMAKAFHVSPFLPMQMHYRWRIKPPGRRLSVQLSSYSEDARVLDVSLTLSRREMSSASLARAVSRYAMMPHRVVAGIYWQALRLWLKRCPFYSHPARET